MEKRPVPAKTVVTSDADDGGPTKVFQGETPGPANDAAAPTKQIVLGDFRLLKKLGQGGMGAVYKAHQVSLDRTVAVKVMSKELAAQPDFVQRFQREARLMARLDHPNIVRCYEVRETQGYHYLAMEYLDGGSIQGWLKKLGRFSLGDALHIILRSADALRHAHESGLVHRDVKPDNILLTAKGVIKVADLGLAKQTDEDQSMTRTGTGAGTPLFMAPEQARDAKRVDARCDIYALGCMLYTFLTGQPPFAGKTFVELIETKERDKHTPARRLNNEIPDRLDLIIDKMIARKPDHRHQDCAAVIADLEGLGLANDELSFLQDGERGAPAPAKATVPTPAGKKVTTAKAPPVPSPAADEEGEPDVWYVSFETNDGKQVTKKLTTDKVLAAIKAGGFKPGTQASKTLKGDYRALATYPEFTAIVHAAKTQQVADKKGEKYRQLYKEIEQEDLRLRRWRWLRSLFSRTTGFVGFLIWLAIVTGVIAGLFFLIRWGVLALGDKLQKL